jgi:hypothetical protein
MTIENAREFFLWGSIINFVLLLTYFGLIVLLPNLISRVMQIFFKLPEEKMNLIIFGLLGLLKIFTLVFFVAPYLALRIVG